MFKRILVLSLLAFCFQVFASDKSECQDAYRQVNQYRAAANARIWAKYESGQIQFEMYTVAHNSNSDQVDDYLWRINRDSYNTGTANVCHLEADAAMKFIDKNTEFYLTDAPASRK